MSTAYNRFLVLVTGQPDSMATPLPGYWGRSGGTRVDTRHVCTSDCLDLPCPRQTLLSAHAPRDAEYECDIGPDDKRVIPPPKRTPEDNAAIARMRRWAWARAAAGIALLAALLEFFGASEFRL